MLFKLVLRNIARNVRRLLPMVVMLAISFLALLVGNAVLARSAGALKRTYVDHVAGHLSVSATSESTFTIFGSEQLLVGEYLTAPTVVEFNELERFVRDMDEVRATAGLVSSVARVRVGGRRQDQTLFGVDSSEYTDMFPELELVAGSFPQPGSRGIVLQVPRGPSDNGAESSPATGRDATGPAWTEAVVGKSALLAVARETSFTLREVPVTGVFSYPVEDRLLDTVALVDPETARALNGYIYGAREEQEIPEEQRDLLDSDMDSMFGAGDQTASDGGGLGATGGRVNDQGSGGQTDPDALIQSLEEQREAEAARETIPGAWNFLLISAENAGAADAVADKLRKAGYTEDNGYLVRGWRQTVGGTAQIVSYLQLMFNIGLLFVAFGAAVITTNALVLSVLERTREIGTLRALGASKPRVALLIGMETVIVVVGAALFGVALGAGATGVLNDSGLTIDNRYINILFGGQAITGTVTSSLVLWHLAAAAGLAIVAVLYPLKRALGISPVEAMAE